MKPKLTPVTITCPLTGTRANGYRFNLRGNKMRGLQTFEKKMTVNHNGKNYDIVVDGLEKSPDELFFAVVYFEWEINKAAQKEWYVAQIECPADKEELMYHMGDEQLENIEIIDQDGIQYDYVPACIVART